MSDHGIMPEQVPTSNDITSEKIDGVVETVRRLCGWHVFPRRTETITVDSTGDYLLFLPTKHLVDIVDIKVNNKVMDAAEVQWSGDGVLQGRFPPGFRNVTVTITHGYDSAPDLVNVILQMCKRTAEAHGSLQVGGISVGASQGITPQSSEWRIIDLYKLEPTP